MAKVLVTGGTGFVGSHTVAALVAAGHDVRLFARTPDRVPAAFEPHGVTIDDVVEGDVLERSSVESAVAGCDAVLHAANVFTFHPRHHYKMRRVNTEGTRIVLEAAVEAGADPVIHVSSLLGLLPASGPITADTPVGDPEPEYAASKAAAERIAREMQADGRPVVITQPGAVWGPHDPHCGESTTLAISALKGQLRFTNDGAVSVVDVRDVAAAHAALVGTPSSGGRFLLAGHSLMWRELIARLGTVAGRKLGTIPVPHGAAKAVGRAMDWISATTGMRLPIGFEPPWILANSAPTDASATEEALGITWRPLDDTLRDTVRWLHENGMITDRQAGVLA